MGVGGNFWDLLKPYARNEGLDFLRGKNVAVDLSYWIVQHETAVKRGSVRNPHLRITFFRTINLFSKLGAFPVFVVDGEPSPLKARARIERFLRASGVDASALSPVPEEGVSVKRNGFFTKCELLELLGMPIVRAKSEAEALCAQLNREGQVEACITADSDAILYGAKCVIKCFRPNSKDPFECYHVSDIESGLGLRRKQLVAISLLVGNDHDLHGVPGIGIDTAVRFVKLFGEDEILNRLHEIGKGDIQDSFKSVVEFHDESSKKMKSPHCSYCGHPGSKKAHLKLACEYCVANGLEKCLEKPVGFKCECSTCQEDRRIKEQKKHKNWQIKVCKKISGETNFPNNEIVEMYTKHSHFHDDSNDPSLLWQSPKIELLVDFLAYHQRWEPSYIRQRMLPMLSTIFLREMASSPREGSLLHDQYEFDSIHRVKVRYGHPCYVVKWKRSTGNTSNGVHSISSNEESSIQSGESIEASELGDLSDELDIPSILLDDGCCFLLTDEDMELVQAAFPEKVDKFLQEKELKDAKSRRRKLAPSDKSESPKPGGVQLSITEFYRSTKVVVQVTPDEKCRNPQKQSPPKVGAKSSSSSSNLNLSKSVRRRLLFDK
ncbi:Flap endonuclease GEN-like 1 [Acorus gramineus]|uniref:Flap endonuclease GEN-like 1 n=1 Tax=Acorus gramineus TaxID=55184 RepID=A0AAV9AB88_ACOGR|nr:Flap endonuclease GEN-like 1 [Acorus gramineus]